MGIMWLHRHWCAANAAMTIFQAFQQKAKLIAGQEMFIDISDSSSAQGTYITLAHGTGRLLYKVVVESDCTWKLYYKDKPVSSNGPVLNDLPKVINESSFSLLLQRLNLCMVCKGHDDILEILEHCKSTGDSLLYNNTKTAVVGYMHDDVIRNIQCVLLLPMGRDSRCESCKQFRSNLRARASHIRTQAQKSTDRISANSRVPLSKLSESEKVERLKNLSRTVHNLQKKLNSTSVAESDEDSIQVDVQQNDLLMQFVDEQTSDIESSFAEGSPARVFWDQQVKVNNFKSSKSMRWHPMIIRWCISMYSKSPKAYEQLTKAGMVKLPSKSTLKTYLNFTESVPGVNPDILNILANEFECGKPIPEFRRNVSLVWDEMKIKSGLAVSNKTGKLVGFCHQEGDNSDLEDMLNDSGNFDHEIATHVMVLMVRGIINHVNLPFVWYPTQNLTSSQLLNMVWRATKVLEHMGLRVRAWVCDGAASNRTFFNIHNGMGIEFSGVTYCTINRYARDRYIYYIIM